MISIVVGARPNMQKIPPIIREMDKRNIQYNIIHTGQHYDYNMSGSFFKELDIPEPFLNLNVGKDGMTHGEQTSEIIRLFEKYCLKYKPNIVVVVGDVNSALSCSIVVSKISHIKLAHIESGCRRRVIDTPEEVNRRVSDILSDILFCADQESYNNLIKENISRDKVYMVGDLMADNVLYNSKCMIRKDKNKILVTLHRPYNVDNPHRLLNIISELNRVSENVEVLFPMHPRTKKNIEKFKIDTGNIIVTEPLSPKQFLQHMMECKCVITDSGGIQVETSVLDIPCITVNNTTVHGSTLNIGTNTLIDDINLINPTLVDILKGNRKHKQINSMIWDGFASKRIVNILRNYEEEKSIDNI